jgi:hypothetical protein
VRLVRGCGCIFTPPGTTIEIFPAKEGGGIIM